MLYDRNGKLLNSVCFIYNVLQFDRDIVDVHYLSWIYTQYFLNYIMVKTHVFFLLLFIFPGTLCDEHEYQEMFSIVQNKMRVEFEEIWKHQATQDKRIHELELMIENQNKQIRNLKRRCTDKEKDYIYKLFKEDSQIINPNFESEQLVGPKHNQSDVLKTQTTEIKTSLTYRRHLVNNEIQDRDYYRKRRQMSKYLLNTLITHLS